jgi:pectate lyase
VKIKRSIKRIKITASSKKILIVSLTIVFVIACFLLTSVFTVSMAGTKKKYSSLKDLPVFPGAEGFGTITRAGRGGRIIRVTNLSDRGKGSLREALYTKGPRVIVFEVGGNINLKSHLKIRNPYVTIAGQTAPEPGITLTGASLSIKTHDVLIQHLRIRVGDLAIGPPPEDRDGIKIQGSKSAAAEVYNIVIDHCSISWAIDEGVSIWYDGVHDITISRSIISENLSNSKHPKGEHSKGLLIGDHAKRVSIIGNLFAHNNKRNPLIKGNVTALIVNNMIYNPGKAAIHFSDRKGSGPSQASIVGNVIIMGKDSQMKLPPISYSRYMKSDVLIYLSENKVFSTDGASSDVQRWILSSAGARPMDRDAVDSRLLRGIRNRTGRIIDSQREVEGFIDIDPVARKLTIPVNPHADNDGDGYTNLEEWLHSMSKKVE